MQDILQRLTSSLMQSYDAHGGINHLDGVNLPSKSIIADITKDLLTLLFPGFFQEKLIHSQQLKTETHQLVEKVFGCLQKEIEKSLRYHLPEGRLEANVTSLAKELTMTLLSKIPDLKDILRTDIDAAYNGDPAALSRNEIIVAYPFVEAIAVQRMAHELYRNQVALIPRIMTEWAHSRTGMDLHPGASIGSHFFIDHGTGTVIGETSIIGDHVKMYQGVALIGRSLKGGQALRGTRRHPIIEDRVTLYANATIMGGDTTVGMRSTIGANVFLTHSVPPDSLVLNDAIDLKVLDKKDRNLKEDGEKPPVEQV